MWGACLPRGERWAGAWRGRQHHRAFVFFLSFAAIGFARPAIDVPACEAARCPTDGCVVTARRPLQVSSGGEWRWLVAPRPRTTHAVRVRTVRRCDCSIHGRRVVLERVCTALMRQSSELAGNGVLSIFLWRVWVLAEDSAVLIDNGPCGSLVAGRCVQSRHRAREEAHHAKGGEAPLSRPRGGARRSAAAARAATGRTDEAAVVGGKGGGVGGGGGDGFPPQPAAQG